MNLGIKFKLTWVPWLRNRQVRNFWIKDLTHFLKVVSAEMKNETPKVVEIAIKTFQNSLFLCFYMLETATVVFQHHFSTKSVGNRRRIEGILKDFCRISMKIRNRNLNPKWKIVKVKKNVEKYHQIFFVKRIKSTCFGVKHIQSTASNSQKQARYSILKNLVFFREKNLNYFQEMS